MAGSRLVAGQRLGLLVLSALAGVSAALLLLAAVHTRVTVFALLPVVGVCRALLMLGARTLVQRSAPVQGIASMFAVVEVITAVTTIVGSLIAQVLIATSGIGAALAGVGVAMAVLAIATAGAVRVADRDADMPVVAIRALRSHAIFSPLPPGDLEVVARAARELRVAAGSTVVRQGDVGDRFYLVRQGELAVDIGGTPVRVLTRDPRSVRSRCWPTSPARHRWSRAPTSTCSRSIATRSSPRCSVTTAPTRPRGPWSAR